MRKILLAGMIAAVIFQGGRAIAADPWEAPLENIYWGDLHVHTNFSLDAWIMFLPPGRYAEEAGMYAAHCAKLDFYSITDHAEVLTRGDYWEEAIRSARGFNEYGAEHQDANGDPSIVAFTGWEWTQQTPWGHKNVILKYDDPAKLPPSPIRCLKGFRGFRPQDWFASRDLTFLAEDPARLYALVEEYCTEAGTGCRATIIPHGNAWGQFTMNTDWEGQMNPEQHNPELQRLIEVYSKHGNSEEYRKPLPDYRYYINGAETDEAGCKAGQACEKVCQEPTDSFEPCCWRAGEIVRERCADSDSEFCRDQIKLAREYSEPFPEKLSPGQLTNLKAEHRTNPDKTEPAQWGVCGQCKDCYQPAYNYNANGSVQKALVTAYFDEDGNPTYYRFGFLNSTDTHAARPGSVMEDKKGVEAVMAGGGQALYKISHATGAGVAGMDASIPMYGYERIADYLNPGGLVAVSSYHRDRDDLWESLVNRHVYGTSGARIDLWVRAVVKNNGAEQLVSMGDITSSSGNPAFYLKARGAFEESGLCRYDDHPEIREAMSSAQFEDICFNQCYSPIDRRTNIARIEVVKVRQPLTLEESRMDDLKWSPENPAGLIMDPYAVFEFDDAQIEWTWTDEAFGQERDGRSLAYYFRVIQAPTEGYNCNPTARLTREEICVNGEPNSREVSRQANPRDGRTPMPRDQLDDMCFSSADELDTWCEERAWSSPIYIVKD